jgi:hypothetical protein
VRCAYSEAAGVPSTSLRRIALKPNHTTALHTDSAGTALIQCASLSCAEAAGAEISMAAIQSMAKYSSRFKAPPYSSCFRSRPMKGACILSRSGATRHNHYKTSGSICAGTVPVGLSARK